MLPLGGDRKKTQISQFSGTQTLTPNFSCGRNLRKDQLGGVIFGCKNATMNECLSKQLFGLPAQHFSYVKNIDRGLPLFLFNYTDRKLHGIFEAASNGRMYIDPYGWTSDGSERTQYPAQVQVCLRLQCHPLSEDEFKQVIAANYYIHNHFWFELDHAQTSKLISLLSSRAIAFGNSGPRNTQRWITVPQPQASHEIPREGETSKMLEPEMEQSTHSSTRLDLNENDFPSLLSSGAIASGNSGLQNMQKSITVPRSHSSHEIPREGETSKMLEPEMEHSTHSSTRLDLNENDFPSLLSSGAIASGNSGLQNMQKWIAVPRPHSSHEIPREGETSKMLEPEMEHSTHSSTRSDLNENDFPLDGYIQPLDTNEVDQHEKNNIVMKLKELTLKRESQDVSLANNVNDTPDVNNTEKGYMEVSGGDLDKKEESSNPPFEYQYNIDQLVQEVKELTNFKKVQTERICFLEQKLIEAGREIQHLKDRCTVLESACNVPNHVSDVGKTVIKSTAELHLDPKDSLFLIGGFDGKSWLGTMDLYCISQNVIKSLKPMSSVRSYASVVRLNGDIYVLGGGNGFVWYDTVESYNPIHDKWTWCPSLNQKKGSLSGAAFDGKIFAIGGGNGADCFSDVEMLDLVIGKWIPVRSMLDKRFALAAVELNGMIYATGGFDGRDYLRSAERLDPREHSWTRLPNMNIKRGCHSLVVLNEKLYAIGGFDGDKMVSSIEVFDPRVGAWTMGEPMNHPRGYSAAVVVKESIYMIGGVRVGENVLDTVENYKEGQGWQETSTMRGIKRCFLSAIPCSDV